MIEKGIIRERNDTLDALKGISALLVVLGHCVQYYYLESYTQNYVFNFIYAFHMPFFMALSGYSCGYSECDNTWIKRRIVRLLVPFFVWASIHFLIATPLTGYTIPGMAAGLLSYLWNTVLNPSGGLWFLYVLCAESVLLWLINKSKHAKKITVIAIVFCMLIMLSGWKEYRFGIKYIVQYFPWVAGGWLLYDYKVTNGPAKNLGRWAWVLGGALFLIYSYGVKFLRYAGEPLYAKALHRLLGTTGATILIRMGEAYLFPLVGSIVVCFCVFLFKGRLKSVVAFVGGYTLEIYVIHTQLFMSAMRRMTEFAVVEILMKLIVLTAISILLAIFVRKIKPLGCVLFGYGLSSHEVNRLKQKILKIWTCPLVKVGTRIVAIGFRLVAILSLIILSLLIGIDTGIDVWRKIIVILYFVAGAVYVTITFLPTKETSIRFREVSSLSCLMWSFVYPFVLGMWIVVGFVRVVGATCDIVNIALWTTAVCISLSSAGWFLAKLYGKKLKAVNELVISVLDLYSTVWLAAVTLITTAFDLDGKRWPFVLVLTAYLLIQTAIKRRNYWLLKDKNEM